ncbi:hypothetical protein MPSEU_000301600 [Mayamaea pseudoterrestris]|nr:hypothetical protein MPSEU_000301600 [Mayamaea pseudoterrestris]
MALSRIVVISSSALTELTPNPLRLSKSLAMVKRKQSAESIPSGSNEKKRSSTRAVKVAAANKNQSAAVNHKLAATLTITDTPWYTIFTKNDERYNHYMSTEWSYEKRGDDSLFELLSLEGAQAGLSWRTILHKREQYRECFYQFNVDQVAAMTSDHVTKILAAPAEDAIVRHKGKIESVIHNAKCIQTMRREAQDAGESTEQVLDRFLWSFVNDQPILNGFAWTGTLQGQPATSDESIAMSKTLKKLGFKFVGPTICYSLMQSAGMVIDHPMDCPEWTMAHVRLQKRSGGFQDRRNV